MTPNPTQDAALITPVNLLVIQIDGYFILYIQHTARYRKCVTKNVKSFHELYLDLMHVLHASL